MDWTEVIKTLIEVIGAGGGILGIVTLVEKKSALMLENAKELADGFKQLAEEYQDREKETYEENRALRETVAALHSDKGDLSERLDAKNTECAVAKMMICDKVQCTHRRPPYGQGLYYNPGETQAETEA